jgi:hypothetical protein
MPKMAALAPIPRPNVSTAAIVNPGFLARDLKVCFRS